MHVFTYMHGGQREWLDFSAVKFGGGLTASYSNRLI